MSRPNLTLTFPKRSVPPEHRIIQITEINQIQEIVKKTPVYQTFISPQNSILFLGDIDAAQDIELLRRYQIRAVVNISATVYPRQLNINYLDIEMHDRIGEDIRDAISKSNPFIHRHLENGSNVLVHCRVAISRSPTLIAAYLLQYYADQFPPSPLSISDSMDPFKLEPVVDSVMGHLQGVKPNIDSKFVLELNILHKEWEADKDLLHRIDKEDETDKENVGKEWEADGDPLHRIDKEAVVKEDDDKY